MDQNTQKCKPRLFRQPCFPTPYLLRPSVYSAPKSRYWTYIHMSKVYFIKSGLPKEIFLRFSSTCWNSHIHIPKLLQTCSKFRKKSQESILSRALFQYFYIGYYINLILETSVFLVLFEVFRLFQFLRYLCKLVVKCIFFEIVFFFFVSIKKNSS